MAYEMLTGSLPFPANSPLQLAMAQKRSPAQRPIEVRKELTPAVDRLILQALQSEPAQRPKDVARFSAELAEALENTEHEIPWTARSRASVYMGVLVAVSLAGSFWIYRAETHQTAQQMRAAHAAPPATAPIASPTLILTIEQKSAGNPVIPSVAGDVDLANGSEFRLVVRPSEAGHLYLFSRDSQKGVVRILFPSATSETAGSWLGDQQTVRIPEDDWFHFESRVSAMGSMDESHDFLFIVWASHALSDLEAALAYANKKDRGRIPGGPLQAAIEARLLGSYSPLEIRGSSLALDLSGKDPMVNRLKIRVKRKM